METLFQVGGHVRLRLLFFTRLRNETLPTNDELLADSFMTFFFPVYLFIYLFIYAVA